MYKFYSFDANNFWKIPFEQGKVHFDTFTNFNDTFESYFSLNGTGSFDARKRKLIDWNPESEHIKGFKSDKDIDSYISKLGFDSVRSHFITGLAKYGITCFSKTNDQILMWAHYARKQSGFCLEFDKSTVHEAGRSEGLTFLDVEYTDTFPQRSIFDDSPMWEVLKYKYQAWSYENEIRAIKNSPGLLTVGSEALKSITLGEKFLKTPEAKLLKCVIEESAPHLREAIKIIHRDSSSYKLNVRPLSWICWV